MYILQIGRTARLVNGISNHVAVTECRVLFTYLLAACILPACRVLRCQFAVGNHFFCPPLCLSIPLSASALLDLDLSFCCLFGEGGLCRSNMLLVHFGLLWCHKWMLK